MSRVDARTLNRLREHSQPGHLLEGGLRSVIAWDDEPRRRFCRCSCTWFGWLTECDELDALLEANTRG